MKTPFTKVAELSNLGMGYRKIAQELGFSERRVRDLLQDIKRKADKGVSILYIGDPHADPDESNDRFTWLGKEIVQLNPTYAVNAGDMADLNSLNSFEKGKKSMEGKRYRKDVDATVDAQEKLFAPIYKVGLETDFHITIGNHENRINRATNEDAKLEGTISLEDLQYEEFGWKVTPYKDILMLEGIAFTHHFTAGRMDRPLSTARSMLQKVHGRAIQGHAHIWDYDSATLPNGEKIFALVGGCFFEKKVTYVSPAEQRQWFRGITMLRSFEGEVGLEWDIERISLERLKAKHS